jgi:hypothetical protein
LRAALVQTDDGAISARASAVISALAGNPISREHSKRMPVARDELGFPPARE